MERGAHGDLTSIVPPVTGPAWTSFMTGKNPGKHGVYEFFQPQGDRFDDLPVNALRRDGQTVWDLLGQAGEKVIIVNVPVTYPPQPVNGVLISGFLTPRRRDDFSHPPALLEEIEAALGPYRLHLNTPYQAGKVDVFLDELFEVLDYRMRVLDYLVQRYEWNFLMFHILGTDRLQHELGHLLDPNHPSHDPEEAERYLPRILTYFQRVDEALGRLVDRSEPQTTVFVLSDHGSGPIYKFMSFNVWLMREGFLRLKRDPPTLAQRLLFELGLTPELGYKVAARLGWGGSRLSVDLDERARLLNLIGNVFLSFDNVDWARTRAYSKGNYGQIFVNVKGREPFGAVEGGAEYDQVCEDIIIHLRRIRDPETGERIIGEIFRAEDLYDGKYAVKAPDILFLPRDMRYKALGTLAFISNRFLRPSYGLSGDHRMNGLLICAGPLIKPGQTLEGARLIDVAPTVLHLMGQKVPRDMDGRVLMELFLSEFRQNHPVEYSDALSETGISEEYSADDASAVARRLRDLGYLG
jgi:predicted AlkP superfamily phosphohydrolase/phosphomutase